MAAHTVSSAPAACRWQDIEVAAKHTLFGNQALGAGENETTGIWLDLRPSGQHLHLDTGAQIRTEASPDPSVSARRSPDMGENYDCFPALIQQDGRRIQVTRGERPKRLRLARNLAHQGVRRGIVRPYTAGGHRG